MNIDGVADSYDCQQIFSPYSKEELPFSFKDGEEIDNSEKLLNCWFIENPINKELVKNMTLRFGPNVEKEFIIVLKAPTNKYQMNMTSFINIKMA